MGNKGGGGLEAESEKGRGVTPPPQDIELKPEEHSRQGIRQGQFWRWEQRGQVGRVGAVVTMTLEAWGVSLP